MRDTRVRGVRRVRREGMDRPPPGARVEPERPASGRRYHACMNVNDRIARNLLAVREAIAAACRRSDRAPGGVRLVAVTKSATPEEIGALLALGQRDLGENRVQQLAARAAAFGCRLGSTFEDGGGGDLPCWHMIGHLQRNKVKTLLEHSRTIHSIDSDRLAVEVERQAARFEGAVDVLLELNLAGDQNKTGAAPDDAARLAELIEGCRHLRLRGLMTMAPLTGGLDAARPCFASLRETLASLRQRGVVGDRCRELSMGMSGDYAVAVEEGATIVRVGSALFNPEPECPAVP